ncbi:MAG: hypothetical protein ACOYX5_07740 [Actinomycetota bacterium]
MSEPVRSVLFVCTANICRSAYAAVVAAAHHSHPVQATSAGTHGRVDDPIDHFMAAELERRGYDGSAHRSRPLTRRLVDEADLILTATAEHRTFVLQEWPIAVRRTFSIGQLASALEVVPADVAGKDLLVAARKARATAHPEHDVADPYGRGAEAAAVAARDLDSLLERILPRLASG